MNLRRIHFESIDSTNAWVKRQWSYFDQECITLVTANEQTAGKGRLSRPWTSPSKQNIYATFCFFIPQDQPNIGNLPQIMALSLSTVLKSYELHPKLKWPNDLLLNNKKFAGILTETVAASNLVALVLGIGINVNMPQELCDQIDQPATSLFLEKASTFDTESLLENLYETFHKNLETFYLKGFSPFLNDYKENFSHQVGQKLGVFDGKNKWSGFFHEINKDGSLLLRLENGSLKTFMAGEIFLP